MRIAFFQRGTPCHGLSPFLKPLGGTESALIFMARALAQRGHEVFVFCDCDREGIFEGVRYYSYLHFESFALSRALDVFISIRTLLPFLAGRFAPVQIYLSPDAADQPFLNSTFSLKFEHEKKSYEIGLYSLAYVASFIDAVFCVGAWQAETFIQKFRLDPQRVHVVGNGVTDEFFVPPSSQPKKQQIIYASTPFRGLEFLLQMFPRIRQRVPQATCLILSGMQLYGSSDAEDQKNYGKLYSLARQEGVVLLPPVTKKEMVSFFAQSRLMAYPNTFAETFCIAALEAQAAGLPVVSTQLAALKERVSSGVDGFLIPGHPSQASYQEEFIEKVVALLTQDALCEEMAQKSRLKALDFTYDKLALAWEQLFKEIPPLPCDAVFKPKPQEFAILVGGYSKKLKLSGEIIEAHLREALKNFGFTHRASPLLEKYVQ